MMSELNIRVQGAAGRITLCRPEVLNALTHSMCTEIEKALESWRNDDAIALVVIDSEGDRAFCAGGDLRKIYDEGKSGSFAPARNFWRDEYRLNLTLSDYPKPIVSMMHGYTFGGGVGLGCHASHRVVCETSQIALPEVSIGLVPDVGSTWLLARAPGHLGEYLGITADRMGPGDAIHAGFADYYIPQERWSELLDRLESGRVSAAADLAEPAPLGNLEGDRGWIDSAFIAPNLGRILRDLDAMDFEDPNRAAAAMRKNSPLAMAAALVMVRNLRSGGGLGLALAQEYRFAYRSMLIGDFLEGIRSQIIDRDQDPKWRHTNPAMVSSLEVAEMLAPLGDAELKLGQPLR